MWQFLSRKVFRIYFLNIILSVRYLYNVIVLLQVKNCDTAFYFLVFTYPHLLQFSSWLYVCTGLLYQSFENEPLRTPKRQHFEIYTKNGHLLDELFFIPGSRSLVVLPLWGGEVGCSTRGEGEACPGSVKRYRQRLAPDLGSGPQGQHLVKQKKKKFMGFLKSILIIFLQN